MHREVNINTAKPNTLIPLTNPHAVCGRPTLKDVERSVWNGSVRELCQTTCQRSIYERTTMSELIKNHFISIELSTDCNFLMIYLLTANVLKQK